MGDTVGVVRRDRDRVGVGGGEPAAAGRGARLGCLIQYVKPCACGPPRSSHLAGLIAPNYPILVQSLLPTHASWNQAIHQLLAAGSSLLLPHQFHKHPLSSAEPSYAFSSRQHHGFPVQVRSICANTDPS